MLVYGCLLSCIYPLSCVAAHMMYGRGGGPFSLTAETSRVEAAKVSFPSQLNELIFALYFRDFSLADIVFIRFIVLALNFFSELYIGVFLERRES